LINYIIKLGHPVPELNFVLDENKGNLQAAQNSFLFMVVINSFDKDAQFLSQNVILISVSIRHPTLSSTRYVNDKTGCCYIAVSVDNSIFHFYLLAL
jgi:hypothetical protein